MPTFLLPVTHRSLSFASSLLHFTARLSSAIPHHLTFLLSSRSRDLERSLRLNFPSLLIAPAHATISDWSNSRDLSEALAQCDGAILAASGCGDDVLNVHSNTTDEWLQCEQNVASRVSPHHRVFKLSWTQGFVTDKSASLVGRENYRLEEALKQTFYGPSDHLTIVRAPSGMDAFLRGRLFSLVCARTLSISLRAGRIAFIHPLDVAESLSALLVQDAHGGGVYPLTGPEALTLEQVARQVSQGLHDTVKYSYFPLWAVHPARWVRGVPGDAIQEEMGVARALEAGAQQEVATDVMVKLLGHQPRSFRDFVAKHAHAWPRTRPL